MMKNKNFGKPLPGLGTLSGLSVISRNFPNGSKDEVLVPSIYADEVLEYLNAGGSMLILKKFGLEYALKQYKELKEKKEGK